MFNLVDSSQVQQLMTCIIRLTS